LASQVKKTSGFLGNFTSLLESDDGIQTEIDHGVTILATGAQEYKGEDYGYGHYSCVVTQQELESILHQAEFNSDTNNSNTFNSVVMIQCVGPADKFCSRLCCTVALKNALAIKEQHPTSQITILYKDIRTYGKKEKIYTIARENGVIFIRYDDNHKPQITANHGSGHEIRLTVHDIVLGRDISITPDLLVLSMPVIPNSDCHDLANTFKIPIDADGFFQEAHVKLRPVDFSTDGIFMAGMAHYPKFIDESIIQAQAAAGRASRILSQQSLKAGGQVAVVDEELCTGCLTCVRVCPFGVPQIKPNLVGAGNILGAAYIETAVCQGCGSCAAECPAHAIQLMHYTDAQMSAKVNALLHQKQDQVLL
jgi:heterodisulfide reductase subunit A